jgi:hypothetical protein
MSDELSEAARRLAGHRPRQTVTCAQCGTPFETYATGRVGRYCSTPCRQKAYQLAHAEEEKARKRRSYQRRKARKSGAGDEPSTAEQN